MIGPLSNACVRVMGAQFISLCGKARTYSFLIGEGAPTDTLQFTYGNGRDMAPPVQVTALKPLARRMLPGPQQDVTRRHHVVVKAVAVEPRDWRCP